MPRLGVGRFADRQHDELRRADVDEPLDGVTQRIPTGRHERRRIVDVGSAAGQLGEQQVGHLPEGVGDQHAVVVGVDRSVVLGGDLLDDGPARLGIGRRDERRQPSIGQATDAAQLRRRDAAEPHVQPVWLGAHLEGLVVEALAVVVDDVVPPARPHDGERLVEPSGPLRPFDAERLVLGAIGDAQAERRQQAPTGHHGQRGKLLGQHDGVASREHEHAHAELEAARPAGGVGHGHDRIRCLRR